MYRALAWDELPLPLLPNPPADSSRSLASARSSTPVLPAPVGATTTSGSGEPKAASKHSDCTRLK